MDSSVIQDIKSRLNIVDVVGGYLKLSKSGTHWKANCPFHNEKTPSFMVNEERQIFHCFGCGKGGDMFSFVEEIEGIDFKETLRLLAEKAGVELPKYRRESVFSSGGVEEPDRTKEILELATKFYEKQLWDGEGRKAALPYLRKRGLSDESIRSFRLGYSPEGWRHASDFLASRGYRMEEMEKAGLIIRKSPDTPESYKLKTDGARYYDRFRNRIMFPISDIVGRIIGYSARVAPGGDESQAKYINTPETGVYHKGRAIYGIYQAKQAIKEAGFVLLVEGQMDTVACHQAGIRNTVAVSGTALTAASRDEDRWFDNHLDILKRYAKETRLFFDMDGAGQAAAWKSAMLAFEKELQVSIVSLPHGKDAADAALEDVSMLRKAIESPKPAAKYFLEKYIAENDPKTASGKRVIVEQYAPLLLSMKNPIERGFWQKELADAVGVEEKAISSVLQSVSDRDRRDIASSTGSYEGGKEPFARRADALRDRIIGVLLLDGGLVGKVTESISDREKSFLSSDRIFSLLLSGGEDIFSRAEEDSLKRRAAELLFEAEKLSSVDQDDLGVAEVRAKLLSELLSELSIELRKEERADIIRELDEARKSGDKDRERRLMERFSELSKQV